MSAIGGGVTFCFSSFAEGVFDVGLDVFDIVDVRSGVFRHVAENAHFCGLVATVSELDPLEILDVDLVGGWARDVFVALCKIRFDAETESSRASAEGASDSRGIMRGEYWQS